MPIHTSETMLIAVTSLKSLDVVCEYAIELAKRTGKNAMLFVLVVHENDVQTPLKALEDQKLLDIKRIGKEADVEIQFKVTQGKFSDEVAEYLYDLDCPLLVVGEGDNRARRLRELKEIENILLANKSWHHQKSHHFLMVSERRTDPVLIILNQEHQRKGRKNKKG